MDATPAGTAGLCDGAIPTAELAPLPTATAVGASYGAQTLTVDAPDKALANAFVEAGELQRFNAELKKAFEAELSKQQTSAK